MMTPMMPTTIGATIKRRPVADAGILQQQIGGEGAHHVLGAVREIDDVEHAEDDGEPEAQQRVERAVDQPDQQLPEQRRATECRRFRTCEPCSSPRAGEVERGPSPGRGQPSPAGRRRSRTQRGRCISRFTSGQPPSLSGRNASSAGMVARELVEVAGILGLRRLLHLEQIGRVDLAAVDADRCPCRTADRRSASSSSRRRPPCRRIARFERRDAP